MLDLLIATLEMMGLTFVIGFFVAFIIKMIATQFIEIKKPYGVAYL